MVTFGRELDWQLVCAPPYETGNFESPLEARFAHQACKYFQPGTWLDAQFPIATERGQYRLDFVATSCQHPWRRVGFECDGREFHKDQLADARRDRAILETGFVESIWRLRGMDLAYRPEDCLWLISRWNAELFSERGLINLAHLASQEAKDVECDYALQEHVMTLPYADRQGGPSGIKLVRRTLPIFLSRDAEKAGTIVLGEEPEPA